MVSLIRDCTYPLKRRVAIAVCTAEYPRIEPLKISGMFSFFFKKNGIVTSVLFILILYLLWELPAYLLSLYTFQCRIRETEDQRALDLYLTE